MTEGRWPVSPTSTVSSPSLATAGAQAPLCSWILASGFWQASRSAPLSSMASLWVLRLAGGGVPIPLRRLPECCCTSPAPPSLGGWHRAQPGQYTARCHGDPLGFLPKEDSFFQPRSSAWAATLLYALGTRLPNPTTSALCHRAQLVEGGWVLNHNLVSEDSMFWLEGEEGKAQEMRPPCSLPSGFPSDVCTEETSLHVSFHLPLLAPHCFLSGY